MDGILSIFQGIANAEGEGLNTYLSALEEHQSFRLKGISGSDPIVQHVTSVLSKPATRHEGLVLLKCYLEQCSVEALEQKGHLWITLTLKACNAKESESVGELVYIVLKTLAIKSVEIPDLHKSFISNFLTKIYESLAIVAPCAYQSALECIETLLLLHPGPSGPSRGAIEKFLYKFTDTTESNLSHLSGKCLHLLQQVRGGGVQGISHKAAWQAYQIKLLGSLHNLMDLAFVNCTELYDDAVEKEQLNITPLELSNEPVKRAMQIYIRMRNLIKYLIAALRQSYPVPKAVAPKKILNFIIRGLSVTCPMLQKNQVSDNLAIGALLPKLQTHFWELLESLILTLKSHLAMYHTSILGIILDTLKWTSSKKSAGHQKPYSSLRSCAYRALSLWCTTMKHGSRCEIIADKIIEEIMFDITPFENAFTLKVVSGAKKHMSKKARRQLHKAQNEQSNLAQTHSNSTDSAAKKQIFSDEGNQQLCLAALQCLRCVLISTGCFLKPTIVKSTQLKVIGICLRLSNASLKKEHLYNNYLCRLEVYNILYSFIISPHHLCPPPTQLTIKLLQTSQIEDANVNVRETCSMLLNNLEKVIHPQKEGLLFPPDVREIKNAFQKFGKEKLLIEDPINGENDDDESEDDEEEENDDDVIHAEEPSNIDQNQSEATQDVEMTDIQEKENLNGPKVKIISNEIISASVDLTAEENFAKDASIHLDSSNDSVEYVPEKLSHPTRPSMTEENVDFPKSPEMNLRVEEDDDDDDIEEIPVTQKSKNAEREFDVNIINEGPSLSKKPKLDSDRETILEDAKDNETALTFEDIASSFVDELN